MDLINGILVRTPPWVWLLLGYLVWIGLKARRPGETSLVKLAIVPALLTIWSLYELTRLLAPTAGTIGLWLAGAIFGCAIGAALLRRMALHVDRARGVIQRPADPTLLPLLLATFAVKYGFGVMQAVAPAQLEHGGPRAAYLLASGLFVGIFLGKFASYARRWRDAAAPSTAG